jgi:protein-disulfide isomerase
VASRKEQKEQARIDREAKEVELAKSSARKRRMAIFGSVIGLALVAVVVAVVVSSGVLKSDDITGSTEVADRFQGIPQDGVTLGEPNAPATIVEFADLKCPFCAEFSKDGLPQLIDEYISTGKAKIVFRNLTILDGAAEGNDSTDAATMATASGLQDKLWNFVDLFYLNQKDENTVYSTDAFLKSIGDAIPGLDVTKAMDQRTSPQVKAQLDLASEQADANNVSGTPTFFVGADEDSLEQITMGNDLSDITPLTTAVDALQQ